MKPLNKPERIPGLELILFLASIFLFAYFAGHTGILFLLAIAGLLLAVVVIGKRIRTPSNAVEIFGLGKLTGLGIYFIIIAILAGMLLGMLYRNSLLTGVFPSRLTGFAVLASLIGATEELLFRGYFQTSIRPYGTLLSVVAGSLAHTAYKFLFFLPMHEAFAISLPGLVVWTLGGGLIYGFLKEYSKSTWIPVIGHMVFDILVYGDRSFIPGWIWA